MVDWWRVVLVSARSKAATLCLLSSKAAAERWLKANIDAAYLKWDDEQRIVYVQR